MSLSADEQAPYTSAIDKILADSDLNTISAKKIRQTLQQDFGRDLTPQKQAINDLINQRFETFTLKSEANGTQSAATPQTNGTKPHSSTSKSAVASQSKPKTKRGHSSELSELENETPPTKKARKLNVKNEDDDAAYAARLQAELNNTARPTRGGGAKPNGGKAVTKKRSPKKKSRAKLSADDDSGIEDASDDAKKTERGGAFNKPMWLSQPLKDLLGEEQLSRPKTVKGLWKHIKEHNLQNPDDKRHIICDEPLKAIFDRNEVHMFTMNKILSKHLTPIED